MTAERDELSRQLESVRAQQQDQEAESDKRTEVSQATDCPNYQQTV